MGISFKIDAEEGIIYAIAEGTIGLEDLLAHRKNVRNDPDFSPSLVQITEFRMSKFGISDEEGKALASSLPVYLLRKTALVFSAGPNREWALRYKEWVKEKMPVEVFTEVGSAKKWVTSD